ncbi:hypothetical protein VIGAN_05197300, partial [Vigna angularis var. angularis]
SIRPTASIGCRAKLLPFFFSASPRTMRKDPTFQPAMSSSLYPPKPVATGHGARFNLQIQIAQRGRWFLIVEMGEGEAFLGCFGLRP